MSFWTDLQLPSEHEALVAFYDCRWLYQHAANAGSVLSVMAIMAGYFALTGQIIKDAGGRLIKTMGDGGLVVFPAALADEAILALREVQRRGAQWFAGHGTRIDVTVKMDMGMLAFGKVGSPGDEILDVFGKAIANAYLLPTTGLSVSPTVFRSLRPETRKLLKKHTPPIRYIALEDRHPRDRDLEV